MKPAWQTYLGQKGVEAQNQLDMTIEQTLDLMNDSFSVDSAYRHWHQIQANKQKQVS